MVHRSDLLLPLGLADRVPAPAAPQHHRVGISARNTSLRPETTFMSEVKRTYRPSGENFAKVKKSYTAVVL
jgi:hypothetical protein